MDPGRQTVETWAQVGMFHLTDWPEFKKKKHLTLLHGMFVLSISLLRWELSMAPTKSGPWLSKHRVW
jgi:hypothetical protein